MDHETQTEVPSNVPSPTTSPNSSTTGSPMWRLSHQWAHFGTRIEDAAREAVDAPNSRCQYKRAAGQSPGQWDYIMDIIDVLELVSE